MSNFVVNVDGRTVGRTNRRTEILTPISHPAISRCNKNELHFRPVITRWSGSTSRMRVIGEARNANLLSRTKLIAVSVEYWWVGNLYDVCIVLTELGGLSQSPYKME